MGGIIAIVALCIPIVAILSRIFTDKDSLIAQAIARRIEAKRVPSSVSLDQERLGLVEKQVEQLTEEVGFLNQLLESGHTKGAHKTHKTNETHETNDEPS